MKKLLLLLATSLITSAPALSQDGWQKIFNGEDLSGWSPKIRFEAAGQDSKDTFIVKDHAITVSYDNYTSFNDSFGHLFYMQKLSHYKLRLNYRFFGDQLSDGPRWAFRNSGVMLHGQHPSTMAKDQEFPVSVEVQLLGTDSDGTRPTANVCTPGTHVVIDDQLVKSHCIPSSSKTYRGDDWVSLELEVMGDKVIRHVVDGSVVFDYKGSVLDEADPDAQKLIKSGAPLKLTEGYFSLQSESHPVQFKDIYLKVLK